MILSPLERYLQDKNTPGFQQDEAQESAIRRLQTLYDELLESQNKQYGRGLFSRFWSFGSKKISPIQGVYLWGGVGRGKTYLMDIFYESLPFERKLRTHFHRFMRRVHAELSLLNAEKNPLEAVADTLSQEARVICFDEFFVSDITDAMILGNLFKALFERGVVLVATSNIVPDGLYENGLQRIQFLPAIALIKQHTDVVNVDGGVDYRLRSLVDASLYHCPLDEAANNALIDCFRRLSPDTSSIKEGTVLEVEGRSIRTKYESEDVVWFDFYELCDGPRSQNDYIVLAKEYHAVVVSGVPLLGRRNDNQARRFVNLVDEFYDRRVKLVISADTPLNALYTEGSLSFEFARTVSRLLEMQSEEYLALPHRP